MDKKFDLYKDYKFYPVKNDNPKHLSTKQIHHFNENGFISNIKIFNKNESIKNREYFDDLLNIITNENDGRNSYSLDCYHNQCLGIWKLMNNKKILDYVEDLLGPNIIGWSTHYFCKLPYDKKIVAWHQDSSYWAVTPCKVVTVWLAIDKVDISNSAMKFIPGSHIYGHINWKYTNKDAVLNQEIIDVSKFNKPFYNILDPGSISIHSDLIIHGSDANLSNKRRCGLALRYTIPEVNPLDKEYLKLSYYLRGEFLESNWKNNTIPKTNDLIYKKINEDQTITK